jgi:two-component system, chemotaxis family, CheB/CheR fusion protein
MAAGNDGSTPARREDTAQPVIVGIGASAGGIYALQAFFEALPADTGASFVVVVHLDPQSHSELANILAARTQMPVVQVAQTQGLQPNRVYVIPPDRRLQLVNHEISAAQFDEPRGQRAPIDLFLRSLGQHGDGFAVILTGAGSDGALGVKAVKEGGGIILVQDPREAEYPSMPRSAIATGSADFVLPVRGLATCLVDLIRNREIVSTEPEFDEDVLLRILAHVRVRTGHDFSKYKRSTVMRRIARRMHVTKSDDLQGYYDFLADNADEAQALLGDLLISVTMFFRDPEAFEQLKSQVLPELFGSKESSETIRAWIPGCATGEEAYSIAILLLEEAGRHEVHPQLQIFGSDLDAAALSMAREGRFPASIEADVGEERVRRFFVHHEDHYRVRPEVRDLIVFAGHDLLKDPPFSKIDLISCRNLLIYLDRELQQNVCSAFHYALNPGGFLFLGQSEAADSPPGLFRVVDRRARIFRSTARPGDKPRLLPQLLGVVGGRDEVQHVVRPISPITALSEAASHRRAIERVAPPSVLVDATHRLVHLSENAGRYVQPSGGPLSGDVVDLVRPELRFELRAALHRAFERRESTLSLPVLIRFNGAPHRVHLQVKPVLEEAGAEPRQAVVLFIEGEPINEIAPLDQQQATDQTVRRLTEELEATQARLRTVREEAEGGHEELRAANEELQSINEEYRSTAEELETSKEELQSVNEELQTLNSELKSKLDAVSRANSDMQNLMSAADFGTLFLDSGLRIKRFTDRVKDLFSVTQIDEGRSITDFAHQFEYDDLIKDARTVLSDLAPIRREIRTRDNRWYDVRLRPYRTVDNRIDGVGITFVDITEHREMANSLLREKRVVSLSHEPIFIWDFDDGVLEWNRGCEELYGYAREEVLGKDKGGILATVVPGASFDALKAKLLKDGSWSGELKHRAKDGRELTVEARLELALLDGRRLVLESTHDITDRKRWEERQRLMVNELNHRVRNTLSVVQAIAHHTLRSKRSSQDFVESFDARLSALASCHNLLAESDWRGTDLAALTRSQLSPYTSESSDRLLLEGRPVLLAPDIATSFGLVLHELATNAAKYGSLSRPDGTVHVSWTSRNPGKGRDVLKLVWREEGGPPAKQPLKTGFGTTLIDRVIPDAKVSREFRDDGLICTIEVRLPKLESEPDGGK